MNWENYDGVKETLRVKLIPVEGNEKLLKEIPHRIYEDMAMIYRKKIYALPSGERAYATLTNGDIARYGVTAEQVHEDAMEAAHSSCGIRFRTIGQVFESFGDIADDPRAFYIATTDDPCGAWAIFYKDYMEAFAKAMGCDGYYILPSSIHEMLLLPNKSFEPEELQKMVAEINATAVEPEDRLTDSVYYYDKDGFRRVA